MTAKQAERLGLLGKGEPVKKKRSTRKTAPPKECSDTRCHTCGEVFTTIAAEDRHLAANRDHCRYDCVIA